MTERKLDMKGREKIRNYLEDCNNIADFGCHEQKIRPDAEGWDKEEKYADVLLDFDEHNNIIDYEYEMDDFNEYYDGIGSSHLIEHIIDTRRFLSFCYQVLKNKGKIAICCPDGEDTNPNTLGDSDGTHEMLFTPKTLKLYLENAGFKNVHSEYYERPQAYKKTKGIFACGKKDE